MYQQYPDPDKPPSRTNWMLWVFIITTGIFFLAICAISIFFIVNRFQARVQPVPPAPTLIVPTSPLSTPEIAATTPPLAPTLTLPAPTTNTPIPIGTGNVEAIHLSSPPVIDGDLTEWTDVPTTTSSYQVYAHSSWDGTKDVSAAWQLGWDEANLYVAVTVTDDTHVQTQTGNQIFRGDSVDMQFDTDRAGDYGPTLSPDDFQLILSPGNFADLPPSAFRFQGTANGRILDAPDGHHVTLAARKTNTGYTIEAAIPWSDLNLTPQSGMILGLALNVNDNDTPGTAVQELMLSHIPTRTLTDPTTWGTLTLR